MIHEGDIREVDGRKVKVTWSDGRNFSYRSYKETTDKDVAPVDDIHKRGRKKKE